jgi:hypothetical protein
LVQMWRESEQLHITRPVEGVCGVRAAELTPDMGLRSGTTIIFCINAKDDELCEAVPDVSSGNFSKKIGRQVTACTGWQRKGTLYKSVRIARAWYQ